MLALLFIGSPLLGMACFRGPAPLSLVPLLPLVRAMAPESVPAPHAGLTPEALELAHEASRTLAQAGPAQTVSLVGGEVHEVGQARGLAEPVQASIDWRLGRSWSLHVAAGSDPLLALAGRYDPDDSRHLFIGVGVRRSW